MSKDDFKAALVHSFHCRTPSCPVPNCASITAKLQRLHQHVSTCETDNCLLCRMWTHLKYYRDAADQNAASGPLGNSSNAALFTEPLISSCQLLPRWQQGQIAWMRPQDALSQIGAMTSHPGLIGAMEAGGAAGGVGVEYSNPLLDGRHDEAQVAPRVNGGPPPKRRRNNAGKSQPLSSAGVLPQNEAFAGLQGALHTPATLAYLRSLEAANGAGGGFPPTQQMQDMLRLQDLELEAQMGGAMRSYLGGVPGLPAVSMPGDDMGSGTGGGEGDVPGGLPMSRCGSSGLPLNLSSLSGMTGSSFNLAELLRSHSFTQGALAGGVPGAGIPLKEARATNDSNVSLGTFLEKTGGDINEILSEFGVGS